MLNPAKKSKKLKTDKVDKKKDKKNKKDKVDKKKDIKFGVNFSYDEMQEEIKKQASSGMNKYDEVIAQVGDNLYLIVPGSEENKYHPMRIKMVHGYKGGVCVRSSKSDRWEICPKCKYWSKHRSTKEEREKGMERKADEINPSTKGVVQVQDITWACEHKRVKKGDDIIEKPKSTRIDEERIKAKPCFLDEKECDIESKKCKDCYALRSCFQGPQFLQLSGDGLDSKVEAFNRELGRLGEDTTVKIGKNKVPLKGNINLSFWALTLAGMGDNSPENTKAARKIARKVSFPLVYTKSVDEKKSKKTGTKYALNFARDPFIIPARWQERILSRARDIVEFTKPITAKQAQIELNDWLKADTDEPVCMNDINSKDTENCAGADDCNYYKECCKMGKTDKKKGGKKSKQSDKAEEFMDEEDDEDETADLVEFLKKQAQKD